MTDPNVSEFDHEVRSLQALIEGEASNVERSAAWLEYAQAEFETASDVLRNANWSGERLNYEFSRAEFWRDYCKKKAADSAEELRRLEDRRDALLFRQSVPKADNG